MARPKSDGRRTWTVVNGGIAAAIGSCFTPASLLTACGGMRSIPPTIAVLAWRESRQRELSRPPVAQR